MHGILHQKKSEEFDGLNLVYTFKTENNNNN